MSDQMRHFLCDFESLGQYNDFWSYVLMQAPDNFRVPWANVVIDQKEALADCLTTLRQGFKFVERKIKDPRLLGVQRELIEMAFEAYANGDKKRGNRLLQECRGLIWPKHSIGLAFAAEAERRAFGEAILFLGVNPPRFDHEGTVDDLGNGQRTLLSHVEAICAEHLNQKEDFSLLTFILTPLAEVIQVKKPSRKKLREEIHRLAAEKSIVAVCTTELVLGWRSGLLIHEIEEIGQAKVSVSSNLKNYASLSKYFHLQDPVYFPLPENEGQPS